ncbi:MAG: family 43 glycosylhydrolase [Ilumatobacteraceae bacterium]
MPTTPTLPGFHPDPSVVFAQGSYHLVTSTFEYLPGLPVHRSDDLQTWTPVGHVADRPGQRAVEGVPTGGGAWAPTIRFNDGRFHVIVTDTFGRGTVLFTATDPAGPWSDGLPIGIHGIDPDLAWDDDGTCYLTYSGLQVSGPQLGQHLGVQQVRVDLSTGQVLEEPRSLWSGTGLIFPESPHLYRIGGWWYLLIAEGGNERGHAISVARSTSPMGPFEGCPHNPLLTASGTDRPVQCTGHGDLVQRPDGEWELVLLGVWVRGSTRAFGSLGRETFTTRVTWDEDGWPVIQPVDATGRTTLPRFVDRFDGPVLGHDWVAVRRFAHDVARCDDGLVLEGEGRTMDDKVPTFVGRRQTRLDARIAARVEAGTDDTIGGVSLRFDERNHYDIELQPGRVVARAVLPGIRQEHAVPFTGTSATLVFEMRAPRRWSSAAVSSDLIDCIVETSGERTVIATFDGRYLSAEVVGSFTGRVAGVFCQAGVLRVAHYEEADLPS